MYSKMAVSDRFLKIDGMSQEAQLAITETKRDMETNWTGQRPLQAHSPWSLKRLHLDPLPKQQSSDQIGTIDRFGMHYSKTAPSDQLSKVDSHPPQAITNSSLAVNGWSHSSYHARNSALFSTRGNRLPALTRTCRSYENLSCNRSSKKHFSSSFKKRFNKTGTKNKPNRDQSRESILAPLNTYQKPPLICFDPYDYKPSNHKHLQGSMLKEKSFQITPPNWDIRYIDKTKVNFCDDTPKEVKTRAVEKCSDWVVKYM